jgi:hypothetical protein
MAGSQCIEAPTDAQRIETSMIAQTDSRGDYVGYIAAAVLAIALSLPALGRFDLKPIEQSVAALEFIRSKGARTVILATDTPATNVESFLLAKQMNVDRFGPLSIDTTVYDIVKGRTPEFSIERMRQADAVVFLPVDGSSPEWANRFADRFREELSAPPRRIETVPGAASIAVSFRK